VNTSLPYGNSIETATRPIYWNLPAIGNQVALYVFLLIALTIFLNGFYQRVILWTAGISTQNKPDFSLKRLHHFILNVVFQKRVSRDSQAGLFHALIYLGFLVLLFTTTMVFLSHDFGLDVYRGSFYLGLTIASDLFGFLFLLGICLASHRRFHQKPGKLHSTKADRFMLQMFSLLLIQGFLLEGLRIHASNDPWAHYSFVGFLVSKFFWGISENASRILHFGIWWFHTFTFLAFVALMPYSKFFHILTSSLNLYFGDIYTPKGKINSGGDLEKLLEVASSGDGEFSLGIATIKDLDWKKRLELDACTSCGRCQEVCPAFNSGKALSPKWLILDTRDHLLNLQATSTKSPKSKLGAFLKRLDSYLLKELLLKESPSLNPEKFTRSSSELVNNATKQDLGKNEDALLAGGIMDADVFWSCTTCLACVEACPVGINHVDYITRTRQNLLLIQGHAPSEAQPVLRAIESKGTPMGNADEREEWFKDLDTKRINIGEEVDVLYWTGCISTFDTRKQKIAKSMLSILNASGISWGLLGNLESCTGDPARRLGDENTFQTAAKKNIATFRDVKFNKIVTHCPHCFNTIKNEYPEFGSISDAPFSIEHHSVFISNLIKDQKIAINNQALSSITFHDPCYLGRYNNEYSAPREILVSLGADNIKEMSSNKDKSMCCGAGGGHYWHDMKVGERVNRLRVIQASDTGAKTIGTACPFCMQMLEDGVKLEDKESSMQVKDIAELVAEALQLPSRDGNSH